MIRVICECPFSITERCLTRLFDKYPSGRVYTNKYGKELAEMKCPICGNAIRINASEADMIDYILQNE